MKRRVVRQSIYEIIWPLVVEQLLTVPQAERLIRAKARTADHLHALITDYPSFLNDPPKRAQALDRMRPMLTPRYMDLIANVQPPQTPDNGTAPGQPGGPLPVPARLGPELVRTYDGTPINWNPAAGWLVKDQGTRGTCVAFAAVACCELAQPPGQMRMPDGTINTLSEEFLYWSMKRLDPPNKAVEWTKLNFAKQALEATGVCPSEQCAYLSSLQPADWPAGPAPAEAAIAAAQTYPVPSYTDAAPNSFVPDAAYRLYQGLLIKGRPVAMSIETFQDPATGTDNWKGKRGLQTGWVEDPLLPDWTPSGGHCVCVTGLQRAAGADYFIVRNSWGTAWGQDQDPNLSDIANLQPGYGIVSAAYVDACCFELMQL